MPLWGNFNLSELLALPNIDLCINPGVIYLHQVMDNAVVKLFQDLKLAFDLPNSVLSLSPAPPRTAVPVWKFYT